MQHHKAHSARNNHQKCRFHNRQGHIQSLLATKIKASGSILAVAQNRHTSRQPPYPCFIFSENNHSVPIGETSATKISFSAIMTPSVTQKRGIFAAISAKTALASYLL